MIVLDTTVLVYAVGQEHPLRKPCRRLIEAVSRGQIEAATTVEVIQEFTHVRARRRNRVDAVEVATAYAEMFAPLLGVTTADLHSGLRLYRDTPRLGAFDAVLAAAALAAHADALVSADAAFAEVRSLEHVTPDAASVHRLLGGGADLG